MKLLNIFLKKSIIDADKNGGRMKVLTSLLELKPNKSFEFIHAGLNFTVFCFNNLEYSVVDSFGHLYYRGPFDDSIILHILNLNDDQLCKTKGQGSAADKIYEQGMRLFGLGDSAGALKAYRYALELFQSQSNQQSIGATWAKIAETLNSLKEPLEAKNAILKAIKIFTKIGELNSLAGFYINLGNYEWEMKNYKEARKSFSNAINLAQQIGNSNLEFFAKTN
jgi:tetratricopeptide (TPR) repeat protein